MDSAKKIKMKQLGVFVGGALGFVGILLFGMWLSDPNKGKPSALEAQREKDAEIIKSYKVTSINSVSPEENWMALSEKDMASLKIENKQLKTKIDEITTKMNSLENKNKEIKEDETSFQMSAPLPKYDPKTILPPISAPMGIRDTPPATSSFANDLKESSKGVNEVKGKASSSGIEMVDLTESENNLKKAKNISHYLPSGSFTKAVLLSGIDAPTGGMAQQNPMPILMKLVSQGQLPNFFKSRVKDCHATGAAYGDISSERAMIRLEILSCVLEDGRIIETPIKGFVAGEDGKNGFRGKLVSKQGALIARSALAGVFSGMGNAISQQYQQVATTALGTLKTVDPQKVAQAGLASGASNALEKIADFYIARANETYPIIEVDANREGEIVLTSGSELEFEIAKREDE